MSAFLFGTFVVACHGGATFAADDEAADFERWRTFDQRTRGRVFRNDVDATWFGPDQDKFWYRVRIDPDAYRYILVDARRGKRTNAFDHQKLASALGEQAGVTVNPDRIDLNRLSFTPDLKSCQFRLAGKWWRFDLPAGPLNALEKPGDDEQQPTQGLEPRLRVRASSGRNSERTPIVFDNRLAEPLECYWVTADGQLRAYGIVDAHATRELSTFAGHAWVLKSKSGGVIAAFVAGEDDTQAIVDAKTPKPKPLANRRRGRRSSRPANSPDGAWRVRFEDGDLFVVDAQTNESKRVTEDGAEQNSYGGRVWWSPDSKAFVVMKTRRGSDRKIHMIDSAPDDSIHSQLITIPYVKPGDAIDHPRPVLVRVDDLKPRLVDNRDFDNPYSINDLRWQKDSSSFSFVYNQRGHQVLRLVAVDAVTATPRVVIDESSATFICYSGKQFLRRIDETGEAIWMSERSGWNHLYLIDVTTGKVKNAITAGNWVVRAVERVDEEQRQLWLRVSGIAPDEDPYHVHLIRVNFDGSNLVRLTSGDGDHEWDFSPDERYFIDRYSRVDLPQVIELRDARTGANICTLETADISRLRETGWSPPERFVAKGRDGVTDIHGIIIRPTHFDPRKTYPVLEAIYAGPHSAFVPKQFGRQASLYRMAELGFIVVKIDGMGTSHRSKAFHDVCWRNLADSGFPDRIAWIKAAATDRPEMDLDRVGIWGGSAGGQSAMRALIAHGDFYHAAVADCGCHDNRVDKRWWNEQWMGWPIGPHYQEQSNVTQAHQLQGDLMLIWGELDRNVDPASTMQVVDALIRADKDFEMLIMPGVGHGAAGHPYASRRQAEFFVRKLKGQKIE